MGLTTEAVVCVELPHKAFCMPACVSLPKKRKKLQAAHLLSSPLLQAWRRMLNVWVCMQYGQCSLWYALKWI